jgi:hypothetical protein
METQALYLPSFVASDAVFSAEACRKILAIGQARPATPVSGQGSANYNSVIGTDDCDPVSGSIPLRSYLCQVIKEPRGRSVAAG